MKKTILRLMLLLLFATSMQGCYGKFSLTKKIYKVNGEISDKFVRSALAWAFFPVYGISGFADFFVFNTIEFWGGQNQVTEGEKNIQFVDGADRYDIHAQKRGELVTYTVTHYNFDKYVDTLKIDWDKYQNTAWSSHTVGDVTTNNFAKRDSNGVQVQIRPFGYLPQTVALAEK